MENKTTDSGNGDRANWAKAGAWHRFAGHPVDGIESNGCDGLSHSLELLVQLVSQSAKAQKKKAQDLKPRSPIAPPIKRHLDEKKEASRRGARGVFKKNYIFYVMFLLLMLTKHDFKQFLKFFYINLKYRNPLFFNILVTYFFTNYHFIN